MGTKTLLQPFNQAQKLSTVGAYLWAFTLVPSLFFGEVVNPNDRVRLHTLKLHRVAHARQVACSCGETWPTNYKQQIQAHVWKRVEDEHARKKWEGEFVHSYRDFCFRPRVYLFCLSCKHAHCREISTRERQISDELEKKARKKKDGMPSLHRVFWKEQNPTKQNKTK